MTKVALITGITGQDGSYLAELRFTVSSGGHRPSTLSASNTSTKIRTTQTRGCSFTTVTCPTVQGCRCC
jgi:GDP-D-mannose dehydratase